MTREQIFEVVKSHVLRVLPHVRNVDVVPERSLSELGANSLDRAEVSMAAMEELDVRIPRIELHGIKDLAGLVDVLHRHVSPHS